MRETILLQGPPGSAGPPGPGTPIMPSPQGKLFQHTYAYTLTSIPLSRSSCHFFFRCRQKVEGLAPKTDQRMTWLLVSELLSSFAV